jgi:non-ribosomal peptide synthetase component F
MSIRASGRSALIIAAGLWLGFAGPMRATDSAAEPAGTVAQTENGEAPAKPGKFSKHRSHKRYVSRTRKSAKPEAKADETAHETTASAAQNSNKQIPLPPTVANANAEIPGTTQDLPKEDLSKTEAGALASSAGQMLSGNQGDPALQADGAHSTAVANIVSPDELNEIDRALTDDKAAAPHLALASIDIAPSASDADAGQAAASDGSAWNQTSLIGKIFIAFGGLLTFASAARMFMA